VLLWVLDSPNITRREQMITQLAFLTPGELAAVASEMETWSSLCMGQIDRIMRN
jgi:hypothetical protein